MNFTSPCISLALLVGGCGVAPTSEPPPPAAPPSASAQAPPASSAPSRTAVATTSPKTAAATTSPAAKASLPAAPPPLDLKALERRLKETSAIGVLTKLSLKNQVDDLVQRFRAFHQGQKPPGLVELRQAFDLQLMKVLTLLQDKDAALAKDIDASRTAIWGMLADRDQLARHN